jgi:replication factor A1
MMEVDLSLCSVAAISHQVEGMRPVLQVTHTPWLVGSPASAARYCFALSDGLHLQLAVLATSLDHLAAAGALRRGSVIRVLEYQYSYGVIVDRR